jgi:hypothetical protein
MHRRNSFLADAWKGLVFIVTIRAIAKHYRSPPSIPGGPLADAPGDREPAEHGKPSGVTVGAPRAAGRAPESPRLYGPQSI